MPKLGDAGKHVGEIERLLNRAGYRDDRGEPLEVNERFEADDDLAARWFQAANGLEVDGDVGPITTAALRAACDEAPAGQPAGTAPAPATTWRQKLLRAAFAYHGADVAERPPGSNRGGPAPGRDKRFSVNAISAPWFPRAGQPWCAMFVATCLREAGWSQLPIGAPAVCNWVEWARARGWLHRAAGFSPEPGDVFTIGTSTHIGIVESYDVASKRITTIEGNCANRVSSITRPRAGGRGGESSGGGIAYYIRIPG